jgi:hypothetical protein
VDLPFDQGANCRLRPFPEDQVAFPVAWHGSVLDVSWAFADQHHVLQLPSKAGFSKRIGRLTPRSQCRGR